MVRVEGVSDAPPSAVIGQRPLTPMRCGRCRRRFASRLPTRRRATTVSQVLRGPRVHVADAVRDHRLVAGVVFEVGVRAGNCADKPAAVPERYEAIIAAAIP